MVALAPARFGSFGGDLLVGNFGDGRILAYRPSREGGWSYAGPLRDPDGRPVTINGLWGLGFGNDGAAGPSTTLFFASGPHRWRGATESDVHGLFGSIDPA